MFIFMWLKLQKKKKKFWLLLKSSSRPNNRHVTILLHKWSDSYIQLTWVFQNWFFFSQFWKNWGHGTNNFLFSTIITALGYYQAVEEDSVLPGAHLARPCLAFKSCVSHTGVSPEVSTSINMSEMHCWSWHFHLKINDGTHFGEHKYESGVGAKEKSDHKHVQCIQFRVLPHSLKK